MEFNPLDPRLRTNPHEVFKALREEDPVHWSQVMQLWLITRYDDNLAVLRDHVRFSSNRARATNPVVRSLEEFRQALGPAGRTPTMLSVDPPAHTRMRNLVNKAFTPRTIERVRPHIQEIADELIAALPDPDHIDVVHDLAVPLPVIVIAETLGVSPSERERFKAWSSGIASMLEGPFQPPAVLDRARTSVTELGEYFHAQLERRRAEPTDDLLSALVAAEEQGDLLSEDELLATCVLLLVAGNETTTNLISNGMLELLLHPGERRRLQADPALISSCVEEMLRFDGPAQMTSRIALEDLTLRGKKIKAGQVILCALAAANRDPQQFPDPDRFDIRRQNNRHLAFGYGIHYCLGAPLAIAEAEVAISTLLRHFPEPEAEFETPEWAESFILRGLKRLPIRTGRQG